MTEEKKPEPVPIPTTEDIMCLALATVIWLSRDDVGISDEISMVADFLKGEMFPNEKE
jgi:hypothetical protein